MAQKVKVLSEQAWQLEFDPWNPWWDKEPTLKKFSSDLCKFDMTGTPADLPPSLPPSLPLSLQLGVVIHICNPRMWEAEAGGVAVSHILSQNKNKN
jgi:hypothetical protein